MNYLSNRACLQALSVYTLGYRFAVNGFFYSETDNRSLFLDLITATVYPDNVAIYDRLGDIFSGVSENP